VLKFDGHELSAVDNYVGRMRDGRDVAAMIGSRSCQVERDRLSFILMDHVEGVEMGVGAYFDGTHFLEPACLDWEHKAFFPGDMGELTGEMGTVATFERTGVFFQKTLARIGPLLRANGYCGYVNLNTIVNEAGIWPLEFTCRFGYPGYAVLDPLQKTRWPDLFRSLTQKNGAGLAVNPGFSVGVVLTTPPFPYVRTFVPEPIGLPILFDGALSEEDLAHLHFGEVGQENGQLVTAGYHGWTMVVTGVGSSIEEARGVAYERARRVIVPKLRYRLDIGERLIESGYAEVERLGLIGDA
jgi:phosphoribosylamine--glycine ligase